MKKLTALLFLFILGAGILSACAASRALNQPDEKDLNVLSPGTSRDVVLAELGNPIYSGKEGENEYDIFSFIQGYSKGAKVGRAFLHGVLDVVSLGLWELIGNPIEGIASGKKTQLKIIYKDKKIVKVEELRLPDQQTGIKGE